MTNIVLKKIVLLLSILSSLALAVAIRNVNREEDFQKKVNTAEYFTPFRFPEFIVDPQQETRVLEILESVSEKLNVNYMAKVSFYGVRDHTFSETGEISFDRLGETHTFFLSKQTETHLLNNFYIEPQIISEKNYFASDLEKYPDAEYLENRQLKNEDFFILPIQMAEVLNPADFFVETKDQKTLDSFLSKLSDEYNLSFETAYEPTSFQYENDIETFAPSRTLEASTFVIFTLFYSLSLILWILENNRHIAIYRLNGLTSRKILKRLLLKELVILFLLNLLIAFFFVLHSVNHLFVLVQLFLLIFSLIISFFVIDLLGNLSLNKQLNRQTFGLSLIHI